MKQLRNWISPVVAYCFVASASVAQPGAISIEVDQTTGALTVLNYTDCVLSAVAMTANATVSPKSKFKAKREGPSEAVLDQYWYWGASAPAKTMRVGKFGVHARQFPPHMEMTSPLLPAGYKADALALDQVEVYAGRTSLHENPPKFGHLPGVNDANTANWTANLLAAEWNWSGMAANRVEGSWAIKGTKAELTVERCMS